MNKNLKTDLAEFIDDYRDDLKVGLSVGDESRSIEDIGSLLHDDADELDYPISSESLPKSVKSILEDLWNDRVDGKTLLGVSEKSRSNINNLHKLVTGK